MRQVNFTAISWDTDGEEVELPQTATMHVPDDFDVELDGADLLSDEYGFCVNSFQFEIVKPKGKRVLK